MAILNLQVKHASKAYTLSVDSDSAGRELKERLEALTEVPVAKQKILIRGKQLADDAVLSSVGVKDGQSLFMLGTAPKNVVASSAPPPAAGAAGASHRPNANEEGDDDEEDDDYYRQPVGLRNIGNTCYASSTLQALHTVPELNQALTQYSGHEELLKSWGQLVPKFGYDQRFPTEPALPYSFIAALRRKFAQFAERGEGEMYKQQDAEELYTQLMSLLQSSGDARVHEAAECFDGKFAVTKSSSDATETTTTPDTEGFSKLMCHINVKTNFLKDGLRASLVDEIGGVGENGDSSLTIRKQITKMPKYLVVQFVRFFWRKDTKMNSKILRKVTFPSNLDIGDLCTEDLQQRLAPAREAYRELEGAIEEQQRAARRAKFQKIDAVPDSSNGPDPDNDAKAASERRAAVAHEEAEQVRAREHIEALKQQFRDRIDADLRADSTCSPHGLYDLQAVVSHQGMSADSGHYLCYTRSATDPTKWWKLNDETVTPFDAARLADLAGGGASDSALILVYKSSEI